MVRMTGQVGMTFSLHVSLFFLILRNHWDLLGRLILLLPTLGSLFIHVCATTDIPLVPTRAAVQIAPQVLILAPIQNTVVTARMELFKLHRHWSDHVLRLIGISGHHVTLWVCVGKYT